MNKGDQLIEVLRKFFIGTDLKTLNFFKGTGKIKTYPAETTLCREGELADTFYMIIDGEVEIYKFRRGGNIFIDVLRGGQAFGELGLVLEKPRNADVITTEETTLFEISKQDFNTHITNNSKALLTIMQRILEVTLRQEDRYLNEIAESKKNNLTPPNVFISYSREDEPVVRRISSDLKRYGVNNWIDVNEIEAGQNWRRQIGKSLDLCELMVLVLSTYSIRSENVEDEWNYYLDKKKPIIPILINNCNIPYRIHKLQYISFIGDSYDKSLEELVINIRAALQ